MGTLRQDGPSALEASENPLRPSYWLGGFDARLLALFRIALGAVLLQDLFCQARGISTFYTDAGVFPRGPKAMPWMWSVLDASATSLGVGLLFALGGLATLAFLLGLWTRVATALCFVFFVSLEHRAPVLHNGGDRVAAVLLFLGVFTDLSGRYSLDALRGGARANVPALVPRLMQALPLVLYLQTGIEKLRDAGSGWFDGSVIFANVGLHGWTRFGAVWLRPHPALCTFVGVATIALELAMPVIFLSPWRPSSARAVVVFGHLGLEVGILLSFKVAMFTNVMLATTPLLLMPAWLDRAGGLLASRGDSVEAKGVAAPWGYLPVGVFAAIAVAPLLPSTVGELLPWAGLDLNTGLFAWAYPSMRWEATGELEDGTKIDPLPPEADFGDGFFNSLWMQLPYRLVDYGPLGTMVCRMHQGAPSSRLLRWSITKVVVAPYRHGEPVPPESRRLVLATECE